MRRTHLFTLIVAGTLVTGLSLPAQTPTPPNAGGQGAGAGPAPDRRGGAPGSGRGDGRGGPGRDDAANAGVDYAKRDPVLPLKPEEQLKHFVLQPGYRMELVLADPVIDEPTAVAFDGNGRMFVLEDRAYMQNADATNEKDPIGRISMHEDLDNDGVYEKHSVFVDNLVFPRFVTPFGPNSILTMETDANDVWRYTDTNGDGVADKKELFDTNFGRSGNVEHQQAHLYLAMDNWLYSTVNAFRVRWTPNGVLREPTGSNGAQWGTTQDNDGKVWFQGGASGMPAYFQFPVQYGNFNNPEQFEPELQIAWGAPVRIADMQGGMPSVRMPDGSLNRVTGAAGSDVYRGHRLPQDLVGDYIYGEPVARIVRRFRPVVTEGLTQLRNVYKWNEFIKSTDPLFRPVEMVTAPDGTLYITDMYRGIIQQATWSGPGTYLRARIDQYGLDNVHSHGRIWRLTYEGMARDRTMPRMHQETPAQLVTHLSHANGWWRDTAQQLLVLKQDKSVVPALQALVRNPANIQARFHALWALEGLGALDAALVRQQMKDTSPRMRIQAIRASESLYKSGDRSFAEDYRALSKDTSTDVVIQSLMTMNTLKVANANAAIQLAMDSNKARGVQLVANAILNPASNAGRGGFGGRGGPPPLSPEETAVAQRGQVIYNELCFSCHGSDGRGEPRSGAPAGTTMAPSLAGSPRVLGHRDYTINAILHGLTGPIDGDSFVEVMVPMGSNQDEWVASVASYVRNSFGNNASFVTPADVARVRAANANRKTMWTVAELERAIPRLLPAQSTWKVSASHNAERAASALTFQGWSTAAPQQAGMWLQIELPAAVSLAEVQFAAGGGGRRGGAPVVPAPKAYQLQVSTDGRTWSTVAEGPGADTTTLTFKPVQTRFVRLNQTAAGVENSAPWGVQALRLYEQ
jgi:mono/diheme cytochrome c family protein